MNLRPLVSVIALAFAGGAFAQDHQHRHAPAEGSATPHHESHGSHQSHHPNASPAVMAFHDLMEPLWHSPAGKETNARACKLADEMISRAKAAAVRPSPDHAALIRSAESLKSSCLASKDTEISNALDQLHGLFYRVAGGH